MPNRDGTGPEGKGPKSGRGLGPCRTNNNNNNNNSRPQRRGARRRPSN